MYGACNGAINVTVADGVSPYTWLWSDGNTTQNRTAPVPIIMLTVLMTMGVNFQVK
ncbi:MAG: hypothetical protein IPP71_12445 [Bacteroidetes bacterium]|nr:hypothetical protein [Bacteroidota bacterium]